MQNIYIYTWICLYKHICIHNAVKIVYLCMICFVYLWSTGAARHQVTGMFVSVSVLYLQWNKEEMQNALNVFVCMRRLISNNKQTNMNLKKKRQQKLLNGNAYVYLHIYCMQFSEKVMVWHGTRLPKGMDQKKKAQKKDKTCMLNKLQP